MPVDASPPGSRPSPAPLTPQIHLLSKCSDRDRPGRGGAGGACVGPGLPKLVCPCMQISLQEGAGLSYFLGARDEVRPWWQQGARVAGSSGRRNRARVWSRTGQDRGRLGARRRAVRGPWSPARPALRGRGAAPEVHPPHPQVGSRVSSHWTCAGKSRVHGSPCAWPAPAPVCLSWQTVRDPCLPAPALAMPGTRHYP